MGVVYKLKSEVHDFIVNYKKDHPSISCRKLADMVSDKFDIEVSKSSVNNIIKSEELSNPVGRPHGQQTTKKNFTIPKEKKEQLRKNVVKTKKKKLHTPKLKPKKKSSDKDEILQALRALKGKEGRDSDKKELSLSKHEPSEPTKATENVVDKAAEKKPHKTDAPKRTKPSNREGDSTIPEKSESKKVIKFPGANRRKGLSLIPDPLMQPLPTTEGFQSGQERPPSQDLSHDKVESFRKRFQERQRTVAGQNLPAMGLVFLRAALLALSQRPVLGPFLARYTSTEKEPLFTVLSEARIYMQALKNIGVQSNNHYNHYGFWRWLGLHEAPSFERFDALVSNIVISKTLGFEYFSQKNQLALEVFGARIYLRNGASLTVDSLFQNILNIDTKHKSLPLNLTALHLSKRVVVNTWPMIFHNISTGPQKSCLKTLFAFAHGVSEYQLRKIVLFGAGQKELAEFNAFPKEKRSLIVKIGANESEEFSWALDGFESHRRRQAHVLAQTGEVVYFRSRRGSIDIPGGEKPIDVTIVELALDGLAPPRCVLVGNDDALTDHAMIEAFFEKGVRAEFLDRSNNEQEERPFTRHYSFSFSSDLPKLHSIDELYYDFTLMVQSYAEHLIWNRFKIQENVTQYISDIYKISGGLEVNNQRVNVVLQASGDENINRAAKALATAVNALDIYDLNGNKLFISICNK